LPLGGRKTPGYGKTNHEPYWGGPRSYGGAGRSGSVGKFIKGRRKEKDPNPRKNGPRSFGVCYGGAKENQQHRGGENKKGKIGRKGSEKRKGQKRKKRVTFISGGGDGLKKKKKPLPTTGRQGRGWEEECCRPKRDLLKKEKKEEPNRTLSMKISMQVGGKTSRRKSCRRKPVN